jgi:hypothetical protein
MSDTSDLPSVIPDTPENAMRLALGTVDLVMALVVTLAATNKLSIQAFEEDLRRRAALFAERDVIHGVAIGLMLERLPRIKRERETACRLIEVVAGDGSALN